MSGRSRGKGGRTRRRPTPEEADPDDPSDFTEEDLEGEAAELAANRVRREATSSLELRFGEGNRFEQILEESAAPASTGAGTARAVGHRFPIRQLHLSAHRSWHGNC